MPTRRETLQGRLPIVATLLVPLFFLGQGCEKKQTGKQVEPMESSAATVESTPAPAKATAPTADEGTPSGTPRDETCQADRPVSPPERTPEPERVEATVVTDANFAEVTGKGVVLVDFWAERCPPCRVQGPIVEGLAKKFAGRATIGKLDVDANANRRTPRKFRIMYIPTLIVFRDGEEVKRFVGLQQEATLASAFEEALRQE